MDFLIYIPCHSDFDKALESATKIRDQISQSEAQLAIQKITVKLILSCNSYEPSEIQKEQAKKFFNETRYHGLGYLADINIANGFLAALVQKPDWLWILSANDSLQPNALSQIVRNFLSDNSNDILVTSDKFNKTFIETQIIDPSKNEYNFGLISGVIYRLERLAPFFHNGPFLAWTGWSQLAVIQSAMDALSGLKVKTIPLDNLFIKDEPTLNTVGKKYGHSAFGMLILGFMFKKNQKQRRKFIRKMVIKNFLYWNLYSREWKYPNQLVTSENYLAWNQNIAEALMLKTDFFSYCIYKAAKMIPFVKFVFLKNFLNQ